MTVFEIPVIGYQTFATIFVGLVGIVSYASRLPLWQTRALYTGGEDAMLCKWGTDVLQQAPQDSSHNLKLHVAQRQRRSPY